MSQVHYLQDNDVDGSILNIKDKNSRDRFGVPKPVFIMFYGNHCGHCHKAKPHFANASSIMKSVYFCALETGDRNSKPLLNKMAGILHRYNISLNKVPTFVLYKNGNYIEYNGVANTESMLNFLQSV